MANNPTSGIQTLPQRVFQATASKGTDVASIVANNYGTALKRDFLLKTIRVHMTGSFFGVSEHAMIGFARGDMTVTEISAALLAALTNPEDYQQWDEFAKASGIFWETLHTYGSPDTDLSGLTAWNKNISIGGGKGIPIEAGHGIQRFVFNPGTDTWSTGAVFLGHYALVGIFLKDSQA